MRLDQVNLDSKRRSPVHYHDQHDFGIKMDSVVSHFNVSLIVQGNVTRQCPHTTICEEKGEPNAGVEPWSVGLPAPYR